MNIFQDKKQAKKENGFTAVETLVVVAVTGILMIGVTSVFKDIFVNTRQETAASNAVDQARMMATNFVNEIRDATYGADASFALGQASTSQIIIFTPYHTGGTVNRVRYYISGTTLFKGVVTPSGTPATYNTANEKVSAVLDKVTNGTTTPIFYYYDGDYAGTGSALTQPVNVNDVKFVQLNLLIQKQDLTGSTSTFTVNDGATLRNLKTNLGN